ncbi:MAG: hypothetical protein KatS3mg064_0597 [Tepidiforma sp.]|nr:zinc ribbon domain-containing protein [Tepidiforma sp.]GIW17440.1 MAG: hypothetical protein KatS3mg064_0597 [Tepidiforma sp.]
MPLYDYRCARGHVTELRRLFGEREAPAACAACGGAAAPVFSPNGRVFIPIAFRQVLADGSPGGGGLSWSDFYDCSERELARRPGVEKYQRVLSQPRNGAAAEPDGPSIEACYQEAKALVAGRGTGDG